MASLWSENFYRREGVRAQQQQTVENVFVPNMNILSVTVNIMFMQKIIAAMLNPVWNNSSKAVLSYKRDG